MPPPTTTTGALVSVTGPSFGAGRHGASRTRAQPGRDVRPSRDQARPRLPAAVPVAVGEERPAPLVLGLLADRSGGPGEGGQGAQEALVGLVRPRDRPLAAPAGAAQRVQPAVVADPRVGVALDRAAGLERLLGEDGPGQARRRVRRGDLRRVGAGRERLARRRVVGEVGGRDAEEVVVGAHGCIIAHPGRRRATARAVRGGRRGRGGRAGQAVRVVRMRAGQRGHLMRVPAERRFWQASTTRADRPASADLPQARGS